MRRQCARPGCSVVATATFTFDSGEQTVWLDAPFDGAARAGDLCTRHAGSLAPPRGWHVIDRRGDAPARNIVEARPTVRISAPTAAALATPARAGASSASAPTTTAAPASGWYPRFERGDTLDGVLEATTPLLSRAFRNVRAV